MCSATSETCVDLRIHPEHCGACGQVCSELEVCREARCVPGIDTGGFVGVGGGLGASVAGRDPKDGGIQVVGAVEAGLRSRPFALSARGSWWTVEADPAMGEAWALELGLGVDLFTVPEFDDARVTVGPTVGMRSRARGSAAPSGPRL